MGGRVGETGRSRGMGNCNQDTECDKKKKASAVNKRWEKEKKEACEVTYNGTS